MGRSSKKGPYVEERLLKKINRAKQNNQKKTAPTYSRSSMVIPDFVGLTIPVHNGRKFIDVLITEDMVGHRLGEFSPTRTFRGHGSGHGKEIEGAMKK
jgi:small subunit ribosomal protein S19